MPCDRAQHLVSDERHLDEVVAWDSEPLEPIPEDGSARSDGRDSHQRRSG